MWLEKAIRSRPMAPTILLLIVTWAVGTEPAAAQQVSSSGWFHVIWGDPSPPAATGAGPTYLLVDEQGRWTQLLLDESIARPFGGPLAFDRKRVSILGEVVSPPDGGLRTEPARLVEVRWISFERAADAAAPFSASAVSGPQPWVSILCRFGDSPGVTPHPQSWFQTLMGTSAPGMDHFWRELSLDEINLTGSAVVGWYDLPQPRSYYVYDQDGDGFGDLDFGRAVTDCAAGADADVFFPAFIGINLMFNEVLDCCAWGGGGTLTLDGQTRFYSVTWMPPWGYENHSVMGQEMGHGFGLPHSSGPYSATYDSQWDVMSGGGTCSSPNPEYGCIGVHTVSFHKDMLGWIPAPRKFVPTSGGQQTITISRLGAAATGTDYLTAHIPIGGSTTDFYTVEARLFGSYDNEVPGEAIVIHKVNTTLGDRLAQVVDPDGNGDANDAGARWTPGEAFTDAANEVTVTVGAATATGFDVTIITALTHLLTVSVTGSGQVTSNPPGIDCPSDCNERYIDAAPVQLQPSPAQGFVFTGWSGACSGTASCNLTITADLTVTATFQQTHTLVVSVQGAGTVTSTPGGIDCPNDCSEAYVDGTSLDLAANPAQGMVLAGWGGGCSGTASCNLTITADLSVSATFSLPLVLETESLPGGLMGAQYSETLVAMGGPAEKTWSIASGGLPPGISLLASTGVLSGIPEETGTFTLTAQVAAGGLQAQREYSINISAPLFAIDAVLDQLLKVAGSLNGDEIRYLDLLGNRNGRLDIGDFRAWLISTGQLSVAPRE